MWLAARAGPASWAKWGRRARRTTPGLSVVSCPVRRQWWRRGEDRRTLQSSTISWYSITRCRDALLASGSSVRERNRRWRGMRFLGPFPFRSSQNDKMWDAAEPHNARARYMVSDERHRLVSVVPRTTSQRKSGSARTAEPTGCTINPSGMAVPRLMNSSRTQ